MGASNSSEIEALAGRYFDAWNSGDVAAIMRLHTDDTTYQLDGGPEIQRGKAEVGARFASQLAAIPDLRFELRSLRVGADHFVFEALIRGTRPDGGPLRLNGIDVITVRDGLVADKHSYGVPAR